MNQLKFERIDKGQKRGKYTPKRKDEDGTFIPVVSEEERQAIIDYATPALMRGETTDQIGKKYGITGRTLRTWIIGDHRAANARQILLAGELIRTLDEMNRADGPLPLARAREEYRGWSWLAERRLPEYYGQKQEVKHTGSVGPLINIQLSAPQHGVQLDVRAIEGENPMESVEPSDPGVA